MSRSKKERSRIQRSRFATRRTGNKGLIIGGRVDVVDDGGIVDFDVEGVGTNERVERRVRGQRQDRFDAARVDQNRMPVPAPKARPQRGSLGLPPFRFELLERRWLD